MYVYISNFKITLTIMYSIILSEKIQIYKYKKVYELKIIIEFKNNFYACKILHKYFFEEAKLTPSN